jgi:hypothetical protein
VEVVKRVTKIVVFVSLARQVRGQEEQEMDARTLVTYLVGFADAFLNQRVDLNACKFVYSSRGLSLGRIIALLVRLLSLSNNRFRIKELIGLFLNIISN